MNPPKGIVEKTVRKGTEPKATTHWAFTGPAEYTPLNAQWFTDPDAVRARINQLSPPA